MAPASAALDRAGAWCEVAPGAPRGGAALFLDRDGVIVEETGYLCRAEDVRLIAGAGATIAEANRRRIPVVVVTNQAGIAHGYYGWEEFAAVQRAIVAALAQEAAHLDAVYACPFHPRGQGGYGHPDHPDRKPQPGMLLRAAGDLGLDLARSWLVGDKAIDVETARAAGLPGALQVMTGYGASERAQAAALATARFEVRFGDTIAAARALPLLAETG